MDMDYTYLLQCCRASQGMLRDRWDGLWRAHMTLAADVEAATTHETKANEELAEILGFDYPAEAGLRRALRAIQMGDRDAAAVEARSAAEVLDCLDAGARLRRLLRLALFDPDARVEIERVTGRPASEIAARLGGGP